MEYLAPGVFVEEVSFRSKSIEGVATSTTGFAGLSGYGPVSWPGGPVRAKPRLITSFTEFERVYGGLDRLDLGGANPVLPYTAHAARTFFLNGGRRLYVSRVYTPRDAGGGAEDWGGSATTLMVDGRPVSWRARWPGARGDVVVVMRVARSRVNSYDPGDGTVRWRMLSHGSVVEVIAAGGNVPAPDAAPDRNNLRQVHVVGDGSQTFHIPAGGTQVPDPNDIVHLLEMQVQVFVSDDRVDFVESVTTHPAQKRYLGRIMELEDPEDEDATVWFDWTPPDESTEPFACASLLHALVTEGGGAYGEMRLAGGHDGTTMATGGERGLQGRVADPDDPRRPATGLEALGEIEDIAIVAAPDAGALEPPDLVADAAGYLIAHAENDRFRIAVVDAPDGSSMNEIREFRGRFDSKYAALYHPWIEVFDPTERPAQGAPPRRLMLPPSGFVTGIYARTDIERGVHKAPANEIVRGLTRFEANINTSRQEVLNPEGINALRFFQGRGSRVWGARTMSSDPEWKYVSVRRLFIYLEHSIYRSTQWAVFEPNNERLWSNIRKTVEDFLLTLWVQGALIGDSPDQSYFVRCDRTTMTQNDLDNGRLVVLIGVAPAKPAEFVIFRVGQWTADAA